MSLRWDGAPPPVVPALRSRHWAILVARAVTLIFYTYFGMIFVLIFNLIERGVPLGISIRIIQSWGRLNLWLCGVRLQVEGTPLRGGGALVANHAGWIDIFTLLSAARPYFVSKADVAHWPVVGILSRQIGTVYIERRRTAARAQQNQLQERLAAGERLCFFPEATSTDGQRVIGFKSTLFAALVEDPELAVQPVSVVYLPRAGLPAAFYGWWGEMELGAHLKSVLGLSYGGTVRVIFHPPQRAGAFADRKALAQWAEDTVRQGVETGLKSAA